MAERTGQQSVAVVAAHDGRLPTTLTSTWFTKLRTMRQQPTIAMARKLVIAPALASPWSLEQTEDAPEGAPALIENMMFPARLRLMQCAMLGVIDYGWAPFEKVFAMDDDGKIVITKVKPLIQDNTEIIVKVATGEFDGFINMSSDGNEVDLDLKSSLLFSINVEGTDWYGQPDLKNLEDAYDQWTIISAAAARYDKKIAGSMWVVHYPIGMTQFLGVETSNDVIADSILTALESSGQLKVPRYIEGLSADLNESAPDAWKIELITDGGTSQAAFIDRQMYLDKLFVRGLGLPERSVLEGQFGTKAEAGAHGDFGITNIELRHTFMLQEINRQVVNQVLRINYGPEAENSVYLQATPLSDPVRMFLKNVYTAILANPEGFADLVPTLDTEALADQLGIPVVKEATESINDALVD